MWWEGNVLPGLLTSNHTSWLILPKLDFSPENLSWRKVTNTIVPKDNAWAEEQIPGYNSRTLFFFFYKILLKYYIYIFFKLLKLPYESHLSRRSKIVKILENRPQSSKNSPKLMVKTKIHWCLVFNSFFVFYPKAKHRKHKKILGQKWIENVVSEKQNPYFALNALWNFFFTSF